MTGDLFGAFADELDAAPPAPPPPPKQPEAMQLALSGKPTPTICVTPDTSIDLAEPVASYRCPCGGRDEVKACPAPDAVDCHACKGKLSAVRYRPRFTPPADAGRPLTTPEWSRMHLDR